MPYEAIIKYPLVFLVGFAATYFLVPAVRRAATFLKIVDLPSDRRLNTRPIPRAGGLAVFVGFHLACALVFLYPWSSSFKGQLTFEWWKTFLAASTVIVVVGLIDDAFNLKWYLKLFGQVAAALLLFTNGVSIDRIGGVDLPPLFDGILTMVWFLVLTNAFNLIDGLDGLATGLAFLSSLGIAGAAVLLGAPSDTLVLLSFAGASLAFLRFNFYPASIFLGDSGSMLLGFTLAAVSLPSTARGTTIAALGVPLLAMGVPLFDTMLAIWRRSIRAVIAPAGNENRIWRADMEHLHHRLVQGGLSQSKVALALYSMNLALIALALVTLMYNSSALGVFLIAFVIGSYVVVRHLARVELWDSGRAFVHGLSRPSRKMLPAILYPAFDAIALAISLLVALFLIRPQPDFSSMKATSLVYVPVWCGLPFICLSLAGTYSRVWSRARISEFLFLVAAIASGVILSVGAELVSSADRVRELFLLGIIHFSLSGCLVIGLRAVPRTILDLMGMFLRPGRCAADGKTLIYGADFGGILYLKHKLFKAKMKTEEPEILGFLDDDLNFRGRLVHGYRVFGDLSELAPLASKEKIKEIVVAAELAQDKLDRLLDFADGHGITVKEWHVQEQVIASHAGTKSAVA